MNLQPIFSKAGAALLALFVLSMGSVAQADDWSPALQKEIERIDRAFSGDLGVYIRHLGTGQKISHNIDQDWYLASTVKIPLAIVLMQRAENEGLDLEQNSHSELQIMWMAPEICSGWTPVPVTAWKSSTDALLSTVTARQPTC
jgi:beta-lactamase class A